MSNYEAKYKRQVNVVTKINFKLEIGYLKDKYNSLKLKN